MSHLAETAVIPAIAYESLVKREDLKTVKLKHVAELMTREKKVPIFDGRDGIEGLLCCEEAAREAFTYLHVTDGQEMFNLYKETLSGKAVRKWNNVVLSITAADRSVNRFNQAIKDYYKKFVDDKARNTMYDYLKTKDCAKSFKTSVLDHVDRMEELYRYAAKLPGTVPAKDEDDPDDADQIKELIFVTFSEAWQSAFEDAHDIETSTQMDINKFMNRQKAKDIKLECKKKVQAKRNRDKNKNERGDKGNNTNNNKRRNGRNSNGKRPQKQIKKEDPCPIHGGGHTWNECFDNKNGPNFHPPRSGSNYRGRNPRNDRRESHYRNDHYQNDYDQNSQNYRRSPSPARRASSPSPLTWDETHNL